MATVGNKHFAIEIYSTNLTIRAATVPMEINGVFYDGLITSIDKSQIGIDPNSFSESIYEIDVSLIPKLSPWFSTGDSVNNEEEASNISAIYKSNLMGSRVKIHEVNDSFENQYNSLKFEFITGEKRFKIVNTFESNISSSSYNKEAKSITCKISFEGVLDISKSIKIFDKDTFGQYFFFKAQVEEVEDYVMIPDLSPASIIPLGRFWAFDNLSDAMISARRPKGSFVMSDRLASDIEDRVLNKVYLSVLAIDYYAWKAFHKEFREKYVGPVMKPIGTRSYQKTQTVPTWDFEYGVVVETSVVYSGLEIFSAFSSKDNSFGFENTDLGDADVDWSYGWILLVRNPKKNQGIWDTDNNKYRPDYEQIIRDASSGYQIAKYAFKYTSMIERIDSNDFEAFQSGKFNSFIGDDKYNRSSVNFEITEMVDLTKKFANRLVTAALNSDSEPQGGISYVSDETNPISMMLSPYRLNTTENFQLFDPATLMSTGNDGAQINPLGWFAVAVPGFRFVKKIRVPPNIFNGIPRNAMVNARIDVLDSSKASEFLINFRDPQGNLSQSSIPHERIYETVSGQFAYVSAVESDVATDRESTLDSIIEFYTPQQSFPEANIESIPNRLIGFTTDSFNDFVFLFSYRNSPENISAEGRVIPIVYGYVDKLEVINAISKKVNYNPLGYAGDDIYVICSHPICRRDHNSVQIWWGLEESTASNSMLSNESQIHSKENMYDFARATVIQNPLPSYAEVPSTSVVNISTPYGDYTTTQRIYIPEPNPFHYLVEVEDNFGNIHTGIKLRGDEYTGGGNEDVRFLLKNGLGNSKVYCSFSGMPDDKFGTYTGIPLGPITHPAHIIKHLLFNYSKEIRNPYEQIDIDSINKTYSKTVEFHLGVWIDREIDDANSIIQAITKNSFIYKTFYDGKYYINFLNLSKSQTPIFHFLENTREISIDSEIYFQGYTGYNFRYRKYFPNDGWQGNISLDYESNQFCRSAYKQTRQKKIMNVELEYCFSHSMASRLVQLYTDLFSKKRTLVKMSFPLDEYTSQIKPFSCISISNRNIYNYSKNVLGLNKEKFIVINMKPSISSVEIEALQCEGSESIARLCPMPEPGASLPSVIIA